MALLSLDSFDWTLMVEVVNQAAQLRADRDESFIKALSQATGSATITQLARAFRR